MDQNNLPVSQSSNISSETMQDSVNDLPHASGGKFKLIFIPLLFILIVFFVSSGLAVAIAYEKIDIRNPNLQKKITFLVQSLPVAPKTPKFLLETAVSAHSRISKHKFNISLAAKSEDFVSALGFNQIDIEVRGSVDYSDLMNLKTTLNASVTKDLNLDLKKKDDYVYFKINKIPAFVTTLFKLDPAKINPVLENWVGVNIKPLDTEARRTLDKQSPQKSLTREYISNLVSDLLDQKLLPNLSSVKERSLYKVQLKADEEAINNLIYKIGERLRGDEQPIRRVDSSGTKPSDYIKDLSLDIFIGENDYLIRKVTTSFKFSPNYKGENMPTQILGLSAVNVLGAESTLYSLGKSESSIVTVVEFDEFGKDFEVEVPPSYLKPEEFLQKLMEASGIYDASSSASFNPLELTKRGRDAARLTDLANLQQAINVAAQESILPSSEVFCSKTLVPCSGKSFPQSSVTRFSNGAGWVSVDLNSQTAVSVPTLPVDPVNDQNYHYIYCSDGKGWEMNAVLESDQQKSKMSTDGGDDFAKYEVGSNLGLIDKISGCNS